MPEKFESKSDQFLLPGECETFFFFLANTPFFLLTTEAPGEIRPATLVIARAISEVVIIVVEVAILDVLILGNRHGFLPSP
jgi:hypothetical protein